MRNNFYLIKVTIKQSLDTRARGVAEQGTVANGAGSIAPPLRWRGNDDRCGVNAMERHKNGA